jgi:hypothetical protein
MTRVYGRMTFLTTWPAVGLLFVAFLVCQFGFNLRAEALGLGKEVLDTQRWYTPADARRLLEDLGPDGRTLYARTEVTLDLEFPVVYGSLFVALIGNLFPPPAARRVAFVPVLGGFADWVENGLAAYLAWTFDGREDPLARVAAVATAVKVAMFLLAMAIVAWGAVRSARGRACGV